MKYSKVNDGGSCLKTVAFSLGAGLGNYLYLVDTAVLTHWLYMSPECMLWFT